MFLVVFFCLPFTVSSQVRQHDETLRLFERSFNERNVERMMSLVSDSVRWMSINDSSIVVETSGKTALRSWLNGYFTSCPSCRSEFLSVTISGNFSSVYEKATWKGKSGNRSQHSLAVYQLENGLIHRVWYFPAE